MKMMGLPEPELDDRAGLHTKKRVKDLLSSRHRTSFLSLVCHGQRSFID